MGKITNPFIRVFTLVDSMYHLVIDRITKSFGEFKALDDGSLHVRKNSIHVILGVCRTITELKAVALLISPLSSHCTLLIPVLTAGHHPLQNFSHAIVVTSCNSADTGVISLNAFNAKCIIVLYSNNYY